MPPGDQEFVRIDTAREDLWRATDMAGVEVMALHRYREESAALYCLAGAGALPARDLPGSEEFVALAGSGRDANRRYGERAWVRYPVGKAPALQSDEGVRFFLKRSHLLHPPPQPG